MCRIYGWIFWICQRWIYLAAALIVTTIGFSCWGHKISYPELRWPSIAYHSVKVFAVDDSYVEGNVRCWQLEVARWLGVAVWSFAVITILIGLFSQRALTVFAALTARQHVVICGLGELEEGRERLVRRLRSEGRNVLVLEPDPYHPSIDSCRATGAVWLAGTAEEARDLNRAQVSRASAVVVLGSDDRRNIDLLGDAAKLLVGPPTQHSNVPEQPLADAGPGNVSFLIQVCEPDLLQMLKRHALQTDPNDRLRLRLFSTQEMAARAMLRETMIDAELPQLRKVLLVGVGDQGRLGATLLMRMVKDNFLEHSQPLEVHLLDRDADDWAQCFTEQAKFLFDFHAVLPIRAIASRCGFLPIGAWQGVVREEYDAVFVCIANESLAVLQATRVADALEHAGLGATPVIVSVREERSGFGKLFGRGDTGLSESIRPVGLHDRVFDVVASMNPTVELVAQVLHQNYLAIIKQQMKANPDQAETLRAKPAFRSWTKLAEKYRQSNRTLAKRLPDYFVIPDEHGNPARRFRMEFAPLELIDPAASYRLTDAELERLAEREHERFLFDQGAAGWKEGDPKKQSAPAGVTYNKSIVPWDQLDEPNKDYDRDILRRLPMVLAKADYKLVEY